LGAYKAVADEILTGLDSHDSLEAKEGQHVIENCYSLDAFAKRAENALNKKLKSVRFSNDPFDYQIALHPLVRNLDPEQGTIMTDAHRLEMPIKEVRAIVNVAGASLEKGLNKFARLGYNKNFVQSLFDKGILTLVTGT
jgi:hypothetical protein